MEAQGRELGPTPGTELILSVGRPKKTILFWVKQEIFL